MKTGSGYVLYEPADLGFNAKNIPASTTVQGKLLPFMATQPFEAVALWAEKASGASVTVAVDILPSIDGINVKGTGFTPISALAMGVGGVGYSFFDDTNALSVGNITVAAGSRFAWWAPYARIDLRNADGVNPAVLSLWLMFILKGARA